MGEWPLLEFIREGAMMGRLLLLSVIEDGLVERPSCCLQEGERDVVGRSFCLLERERWGDHSFSLHLPLEESDGGDGRALYVEERGRHVEDTPIHQSFSLFLEKRDGEMAKPFIYQSTKGDGMATLLLYGAPI